MPKQQRKDLIAAHRSGDILVLTNDKVLREGYNVPEAAICFNLNPTGSVVDATQRGGRVTRLDRKRLDKLAMVYDFLPIRDPRKKLVLFSQILGGTVVLREHAPESKGGGKRKPPDHEPDPEIPGIKVVYGTDEVMRITREYGEGKKDLTPDRIREILRAQGVTAKEWIDKTIAERREIEVNGLKLRALSSIFVINGDAIANRDIFLSLCRAIFGAIDVERALADSKDTPAAIRNNIFDQGITVESWINFTITERSSINIEGKKLWAIAKIFGIEGDPVTSKDVFINLCRAIFGEEAISAALDATADDPDNLRKKILNGGATAEQWVNLQSRERSLLKVGEYKLKAIARTFGIEGDPIGSKDVFINLCIAIFGDKEVDKFLRTPEKVRQRLREAGITATQWVSMGRTEINNIKIDGLKINAIGALFGVQGKNPATYKSAFLEVCRAIFGDAEVDAALRELGKRVDETRVLD